MNQIREHWSSRLSFILAAVGSAIGLGILWKFPYIVGKNGGGLFLLAYFLCLIVMGFPLLIGELLLGHRSQRAAVGAFATLAPKRPSFQIAGWLGVIASFLIMSYYSVVSGWGLSYVLMSLSGIYQSISLEKIPTLFVKLSHSGSISLLWHFFFTLFVVGIVASGVRKGIEFWTKIMTKALFVLLFGLFCYAFTLSGWKDAVRYLFYPNLETFTFSSALEAVGLAFFTLSLGQGVMISYGSYVHRREHLPKMALMVVVSLLFAAMLSALTIFPVVFTFGFQPTQGTGLIFQTLPYLFAQLPGALVISTLFFILFVFTALTSAIPFVEVVATNIMELWGWGRKKAVLCVASAAFALGIPSALAGAHELFRNWDSMYGLNFLETIDNVASTWIIPIGGLLTSLFIGWMVKKEEWQKELLQSRRGRKWYRLWVFLMKWVIPLAIVLIVLQKSGLIDFDKLFLRQIH